LCSSFLVLSLSLSWYSSPSQAQVADVAEAKEVHRCEGSG
jgi:hypothetical protein